MAITTRLRVKRRQGSFSGAVTSRAERWRPLAPRSVAWALLIAACVTFALFAFQVTLVPQIRSYPPAWHGAEWIAPADGMGAVAYYRKTVGLESMPTSAFVTAQGAQSFVLYVNGTLLDGTRQSVSSGSANSAYIYDVTQYLRLGKNIIGLCVVNQDAGLPAARIVAGMDFGAQTWYAPSDQSWRATADASLVDQPCDMGLKRNPEWSSLSFDDQIWPVAVRDNGPVEPGGSLNVDPAVYETAFPMTGIGGLGAPNAYFFDQAILPSARDVWLRIAATGQADVYLNGNLVIAQPAKLVADQSNSSSPASGIMTIGLYDVSSDVLSGANRIAVHVDASSSGTMGQPTFAEVALDLLVRDARGQMQRIAVNSDTWLTSSTAGAGWTSGAGVGSWASADPVVLRGAAPGAQAERLASVYQRVDSVRATAVVFATGALFILMCALLVTLQLWRGWESSLAGSIERVSFALAPMLCAAVLLLAIAQEPLVPRPFPFTGVWLAVLIAIACAGCVVVLFDSWRVSRHVRLRGEQWSSLVHIPAAWGRARKVSDSTRLRRVGVAVAVAVLTLLGACMALYYLSYENYWQDELATLYAAQGVLRRGIPSFPSGYIYPKAELFDYMIAGAMALFGTSPYALRGLSVIEYILSLPLTFFVGRFFLGRRSALIALALVVFSPIVLRWGRELRMYEQAELCTLLVLYFFYRAVQLDARPRYIYIAMAATVAMYLSHEETFIVLPALVIYFFATQRLTWIHNRHWWIAGLSTIAIIGLQLFIVRSVFPPALGTDSTNAPLISFSPRNVDYYLELLFVPGALNPGTQGFGMTVALACIAGLIGFVSGDRILRYLSVFTAVPLFCLSTILTIAADRYLIPLLPEMALLAAAALVQMSDAIARLARTRMRGAVAGSIGVTCLSLLLVTTLFSQVIPAANFGLGMSRALGLPYHHLYPDYRSSGDYIRAHWRPGDVVISLVPVTEGPYYAVQPQYVLYQNKALYVFERNGHITDNYAGAGVLLNEGDLRTVLASSQRVWLFTTITYQCCGHADQFELDRHFRLVFQSRDVAVYLRSG